jgi:molybdopterin synthase catalytic subunit
MIRVQEDPFDPGAELSAICGGDTAIGGVCSFVGLVRDMPPGSLSAMTLEHYPGMTERMLADIDQQAHDRWPLLASRVVHRYGRMEPGEPIVVVATASAHRKAAFESCEFLIDWLKTRAPFWKFEATSEGGHWVDARTDDDEAAARWLRNRERAAE